MLRTFFTKVRASQRYQQHFLQAQIQMMADPKTTDFMYFQNVLESLSYAEQRFDSQTVPFNRFFMLLPGALKALEVEAREVQATRSQEPPTRNLVYDLMCRFLPWAVPSLVSGVGM